MLPKNSNDTIGNRTRELPGCPSSADVKQRVELYLYFLPGLQALFESELLLGGCEGEIRYVNEETDLPWTAVTGRNQTAQRLSISLSSKTALQLSGISKVIM
jgi:hypothetical protein